jgi:hypothetical protein
VPAGVPLELLDPPPPQPQAHNMKTMLRANAKRGAIRSCALSRKAATVRAKAHNQSAGKRLVGQRRTKPREAVDTVIFTR